MSENRTGGSPTDPIRIAIFTEDDPIWTFPAWSKAIPILKQKFDVAGLYVFDQRKYKSKGGTLWYLRTFGFWNFFLFALFAVTTRVRNFFFLPAKSWRDLASRNGIAVRFGKSPNSPEARGWLQEDEIDVVVVSLKNILKEEILQIPRIGTVNKHAALLPHCGGLYPFLWARIHGLPTGVSFHELDTGIDTGRLLIRFEHGVENREISMLRFYMEVFHFFPYLVGLAVERLARSDFLDPPPEEERSYYAFPDRMDVMLFQERGFRIAKVSDLFYTPSHTESEVLGLAEPASFEPALRSKSA